MPHKTESTEFTPELYPPFPDDPQFPPAKLQTTSLRKLLEEDTLEQDRVFEACKSRGFFYLDLTGCESGETILRDADKLARVAEQTFTLPLEEKQKYKPLPKSQWGYKFAGTTVVDTDRNRDTAEFFNINKTDMIAAEGARTERDWPAPIIESKPLFSDYFHAAHSTSMMIMNVLANRLGIDPQEITSRHRIQERSGDHIRLIRGPPRKMLELPEIQTPMHTDLATITILMNWLGGLQVWSESCHTLALEPDVPGEWHWVVPKPGCAIVILGDAAVKFTNGVLSAGHHRVIPAPGEQGMWPRYSLVHFVRPEDDCIIKTLEGSGIPPVEEGTQDEGMIGKQWIIQQANRLRAKYIDA